MTPSATIEPHSGVGGTAPSPRNDSPASSRIWLPKSSIASTSIGADTFGSTSRRREVNGPAPSSRPATTYSWPRAPSTSARITRA